MVDLFITYKRAAYVCLTLLNRENFGLIVSVANKLFMELPDHTKLRYLAP